MYSTVKRGASGWMDLASQVILIVLKGEKRLRNLPVVLEEESLPREVPKGYKHVPVRPIVSFDRANCQHSICTSSCFII